MSGASQCFGGTSGYQWTYCKSNRQLSIFPLSSKWFPGLRWVDLQWFSWTSASIVAAASVDLPFPNKRNPCACRRSAPSLVKLPRFSWVVARILLWPRLGVGASLLLLSHPTSLSLRAGVLCPDPLPIPGVPSAPCMTVPSRVTLSVLYSPMVLYFCLACCLYYTLSYTWRYFYIGLLFSKLLWSRIVCCIFSYPYCLV